MSPLIIDIAVILILVLFAWRGAKKGLILTIFSFLALFVAFYGAQYVTDNFHEPVADIIRPSIQLTVDEVLTDSLLPTEDAASSLFDEDEEYDPTAGFSLRQILVLLDSADKFSGLQDFLNEAVEKETLEVTTTAAEAVAAYLATIAAKAILFALSFVLILLIWSLASRALDLTFKLPFLSFVNGLGGLILGLVKGIIVLLVLVWLGKVFGWLTPANMGPVTSLLTAEKISTLLHSVINGTYSA